MVHVILSALLAGTQGPFPSRNPAGARHSSVASHRSSSLHQGSAYSVDIKVLVNVVKVYTWAIMAMTFSLAIRPWLWTVFLSFVRTTPLTQDVADTTIWTNITGEVEFLEPILISWTEEVADSQFIVWVEEQNSTDGSTGPALAIARMFPAISSVSDRVGCFILLSALLITTSGAPGP